MQNKKPKRFKKAIFGSIAALLSVFSSLNVGATKVNSTHKDNNQYNSVERNAKSNSKTQLNKFFKTLMAVGSLMSAGTIKLLSDDQSTNSKKINPKKSTNTTESTITGSGQAQILQNKVVNQTPTLASNPNQGENDEFTSISKKPKVSQMSNSQNNQPNSVTAQTPIGGTISSQTPISPPKVTTYSNSSDGWVPYHLQNRARNSPDYLSFSPKRCVQEYVDPFGAQTRISDYLRRKAKNEDWNSPYFEHLAAGINKAFENSTLKKEYTVYRDINYNAFAILLNESRIIDSVPNNALDCGKLIIENIEKINNEHPTVSDAGIMSTTFNENFIFNKRFTSRRGEGHVKFNIKVPPGYNAINVNKDRYETAKIECELMLKPGTKLKILNIKETSVDLSNREKHKRFKKINALRKQKDLNSKNLEPKKQKLDCITFLEVSAEVVF